MLKLLASKRMQNFQPHLSYVATLLEKTVTTKNERFTILHVVFL